MLFLWGFLLVFGELDLQIYVPLLPGHVTVSEQGRLFLLDSRESQIVMVEDEGVVGRFGRRGEGPGDFVHPSSLWWLDEALYVMDLRSIHKFNSQGLHEGTVRKREPFELLLGVHDGWVGTQVPQFTAGTLTFFSYPRDLASRKAFFELSFEMRPEGTYALVEDTPRIIFEHSGKYALIVDRQRGEVHVMDVGTLRKKTTIAAQARRVSMDPGWAAHKKQLVEEGMPEVKGVKPYEPEYFPRIRDVLISPENHLLIFTWQSNPYDMGLEVRDLEGNPAISAIKSLEGGKRICAVHGNQVVVSSFENESAAIHFLAFDEVEAFVKEHPLVFDLSLLLPSLKQP